MKRKINKDVHASVNCLVMSLPKGNAHGANGGFANAGGRFSGGSSLGLIY